MADSLLVIRQELVDQLLRLDQERARLLSTHPEEVYQDAQTARLTLYEISLLLDRLRLPLFEPVLLTMGITSSMLDQMSTGLLAAEVSHEDLMAYFRSTCSSYFFAIYQEGTPTSPLREDDQLL